MIIPRNGCKWAGIFMYLKLRQCARSASPLRGEDNTSYYPVVDGYLSFLFKKIDAVKKCRVNAWAKGPRVKTAGTVVS